MTEGANAGVQYCGKNCTGLLRTGFKLLWSECGHFPHSHKWLEGSCFRALSERSLGLREVHSAGLQDRRRGISRIC